MDPVALRPRRLSCTVVLLLAGAAALPAQTSRLPDRMSDRDFWQFTLEVSEAGGYFRSDNFLSNETGFQYVIPELVRTTRPGGVYLGVGPEQNFTYIVALKPKVAVIFDIRRGNVLEHLLYKALFEISSDRADFLSRLFSRPRPPGLDTSVTVDSLFRAYGRLIDQPLDSARYRQNVAAVRNILVNRHGFALSDEDIGGIRYVYEAFFNAGPAINYRFGSAQQYGYGNSGMRNGGMPNYADLMVQNDGQGVERSYLATEANFRWVKDLETRNMLIPVVGDFAGAKAIRAVGKYLRDHGATVTAFYASNVEQYLFQQADDWSKYYENVATLPLDSSSTFIRSIGRGFRAPPGTTVPPITFTAPAPAGPFMRLPSVLCSIQGLLEAYRAGKIQGYYDVIQLSH